MLKPFGDHVYVVILAGGSGTRFWPKSRVKTPKQLCTIGNNEKTMIELTLDRIAGLVPASRTMIVTHHEQLEATKSIVKDRCGHYLAEPDARNTAAALTLAALEVEHIHSGTEKPVMISLHADHMIKNVEVFISKLHDACKVAESGKLCLMGIKPTYPETGYGYIELGDSELGGVCHKVSSFREKPEFEVAKSYIETGKFLWNAGYFIWQTATLLDEIKHRLSICYDILTKLSENGKKSFTGIDFQEFSSAYRELPKIAIDNAVCEVSSNISVVSADIGWQDVGSWDALEKCFPVDLNGNIIKGPTFNIDTKNTVIDSDGTFIATIGLDNLVIVKSGNAILVCDKSRAQDVKKVVEHLKSNHDDSLI